MAVQAKAAKKQEDKRKHLQEFVDRFRAKATKARQAQSRLKMLEKMEPTTAIVDTDVLPIDLPSPDKQLSPPIIAMERASVGYDARVVLSRLNLSLSNDDRIGLLGANGNGKSTFAKLLAGRLQADGRARSCARRNSKSAFSRNTRWTISILPTRPIAHVARLMRDAPESRVRARAAQMGFSGERADTKVEQLSGGEKARLLMGLSTFHGPHLIILDEPTNHLDIDSRAALIEAINDYTGAVVLVSHDRYLLEACADRLWLVADGAVKEFDGDIDDYTKLVLQGSRDAGAKTDKAAEKKPSPVREKRGVSQKKIQALEERIAKFGDLIARIDETLGDGSAFTTDPQKATALANQRGELEAALAAAEEEWLALSVEAESA
ncbi:MAG: ATP-binding cassette domain-containing protein [Rhodoblastus sp.]